MGRRPSSRRPEPARSTPLPAALLAICLLCSGCSVGHGRAVGLRLAIEKASASLADSDRAEALVEFRSSHDPSGRFSVVIFPSRETALYELIEAGLPRPDAERIDRELGYVDVGSRHLLVVLFRGKRTSFTGIDTRQTIVEELLVCSDVEQCTVVLSRDARGVRLAGLREN